MVVLALINSAGYILWAAPAPVISPAYAWSGHEKYTNIIKSRIRDLGKRWGRGMDDMQLILEIKDIQSFAKSGLEIGDLN